MNDRTKGNANERATDREGARLGQQRAAEDIPKQGQTNNVAQIATYRMGLPQRPPIKFDNGFLDRFQPRAPTAGDYLELVKWKAKLEGAELVRPDLVDAVAAYRHFLAGHGRPRQFSYERYVSSDVSGRTTVRNATLSIQWGVLELWKAYGKRAFSLTGSAISCGASNLFPYPATENWQKTLGGHVIWLSGEVTVSGGEALRQQDNKAGTHHYQSFHVTVAEEGAIRVRPGDTLSEFSAALYSGDQRHIHEFGRKQGGALVPVAKAKQIGAGELLYHLPTHAYYQALHGKNQAQFQLQLTLHAEDRYNFNPGQKDIATGIPDSANGVFEITGLGRQFDHLSTLERHATWTGYGWGVASSQGSGGRQRQPDNNRRVSNRV